MTPPNFIHHLPHQHIHYHIIIIIFFFFFFFFLFFFSKIEGKEEEFLSYSSSSGDEMDEQFEKSGGLMESNSSDYDDSSDSGNHIDVSKGKIAARNNSRQLGYLDLLLNED